MRPVPISKKYFTVAAKHQWDKKNQTLTNY